ncbi:ribonucleoside-diphosphate reductase class Ib glutaredoxin subunit [Izhakiella capsodis]|uniref:Glutaredoxin-like protein NrdH n=1 Tax=Izhakiella capsodis TaxID=1367852 RepID=A0A1I4UBH5_9GAMM|nr:glutaredoxin-like protein NrdH [Izhakiella capsodis]SFM86181.1 ribonucleoside-diphosphate reductase class Ib glutaredoxin subunit [Izhakiella capsodis]
MRIVIYTKFNCVQCNATKNAMDNKGLTYELVHLDNDPQAVECLRNLGYRQAPVVMTDEEHWSGFRPDKIAALQAQLTLPG